MKKEKIDLTLKDCDMFFAENPEMLNVLISIMTKNGGKLPKGGVKIYDPNKNIELTLEDDISEPDVGTVQHTNFHNNVEPKVVLKADSGKPRLDLVPLEGLVPMARVREFALSKYGEKGIEAWREISEERLLAALLRHLVAYQMNPEAVDEESGLPAIYHVEANAMFLAIKAYEKIANAEENADLQFLKSCLR